MKRCTPRPEGRPSKHVVQACGTAGLLRTLFSSPVVGIAVVDRQMRYRAVNEALARMNGLPARSHTGRCLRYALGSAARQVEGVVDRVLDSQEPVKNFDLIAKLPGRREVAHWIESYFPVHDERGRLREVAVVVVEVTDRARLRQSLSQATRNLRGAGEQLRRIAEGRNGGGTSFEGQAEILAGAIDALGLCAQQIAAIEHELGQGPEVLARRPGSEPTRRRSNLEWPEVRKRLSARELEVLQLVVEGKSCKEVASALGISVRTAETHRARIMMKLGVHSGTGLAMHALRNGLVTL